MGEVEYTNLRLSFEQRGDRQYDVTAAIDGGSTTFAGLGVVRFLADAVADRRVARPASTGLRTAPAERDIAESGAVTVGLAATVE